MDDVTPTCPLPPIGDSKVCRICGVDKPLSDFSKSRRNRDGRAPYCSPCRKTKYGDVATARNREVAVVSDGEQPCRSCGETKPLTEFYWQSDKGRRAYKCIACRKAHDKAKHEADPERRRASAIGKKYGLTIAQYDEMLAAQDGGCAICGSTENPDARALAVDHCHATGRIRGILCGPCNKALGLLRDEPRLLREAATYLETR